jgi:hypothetical protein
MLVVGNVCWSGRGINLATLLRPIVIQGVLAQVLTMFAGRRTLSSRRRIDDQLVYRPCFGC